MAVLRAGTAAAAAAPPIVVQVIPRRPSITAAATLAAAADEAAPSAAFRRMGCTVWSLRRRYLFRRVMRQAEAAAQPHAVCHNCAYVGGTAVPAAAGSPAAGLLRFSPAMSVATTDILHPIILSLAHPATARGSARCMSASAARAGGDLAVGGVAAAAAGTRVLEVSSLPAAAAVGGSPPALGFCGSPFYGGHSVPNKLLPAPGYSKTWFRLLVRCSSSSAGDTCVAEYCVRPRCKYLLPSGSSRAPSAAAAGSETDQPHASRSTHDSSTRGPQAPQMSKNVNISSTGSRVESNSSCSSINSVRSYQKTSGRGADDVGREVALLRGPADPLQAALPLLSFDFFTDACCNAKCRAEALVGEVQTQTPRSFKLIIDGSTYALMGGLLLLLLTSNLTVVERRVDAHVKSLALLAAAYGTGIALWGCEVAALGKRSVFPAGAPRYILGLVSLWLCVPVLVLPESVGPVAAYIALMLPVGLQLLLPRFLFTKKQRRETTASGTGRTGGGWLPQWWGSSRSQQLLPIAALASAAVGMLYVSRVESRAAGEIDAAAAGAAAVLQELTGAELSTVKVSLSSSNKDNTSTDGSSNEAYGSSTGSSYIKSRDSSMSNSSASEGDSGWPGKLARIFFPSQGGASGDAAGAAGGGRRAQTAEDAQREREDLETLVLTRKRLLLAKQQRQQQKALQHHESQPQQPLGQQQQQWSGKQEDTRNIQTGTKSGASAAAAAAADNHPKMT